MAYMAYMAHGAHGAQSIQFRSILAIRPIGPMGPMGPMGPRGPTPSGAYGNQFNFGLQSLSPMGSLCPPLGPMGIINSILLYFGLHHLWCNGPSGPIGRFWVYGPMGIWAYGPLWSLWGQWAPLAILQGGQSPVRKVSNKKAFCISDTQER
jgi:hypothetical protein